MVSEDWNGHAPVFMIHFSSYQKRENAERDQARLAKLVGRPFHIISVNLGREGPWFRVMLGDFSTRDEALAFRQQLADRNTPGMGLVYRVSGTR
jgi:cell division protein FtsN